MKRTVKISRQHSFNPHKTRKYFLTHLNILDTQNKAQSPIKPIDTGKKTPTDKTQETLRKGSNC